MIFFIQVGELQQMKNDFESHLSTDKNEDKEMQAQYHFISQIIKFMNEYCDADHVSLSSNNVSLN